MRSCGAGLTGSGGLPGGLGHIFRHRLLQGSLVVQGRLQVVKVDLQGSFQRLECLFVDRLVGLLRRHTDTPHYYCPMMAVFLCRQVPSGTSEPGR